MGTRRISKLLLTLGLIFSMYLVTGTSTAQEPPGKQLKEAPPSPETERTPVVTLGQQTLYATGDACILEGYPSQNFGTSIAMLAGYDEDMDPHGQIARSLVRFDIASLPPNQKITQATLRLYLVSSWDYPDTSRTITSYRIASNWWENSLTWNNQPGYGAAYGSRAIVHGDWDWYEFDVTNLARAWYNGTYPNYGIMLRGPEVSGTDASWRGFDTRESGYTPELVVRYSEAEKIYLPLILSDRHIVASEVIRTSEEGVVRHPAGAEIYVPQGAVPESLAGGDGEMLFTIEQGQPEDFGVPNTPAPGWEFLGNVFSMGPEGFIFETPIVATMPLLQSYNRTQHEVAMFDYDWEARQWVSVGGRVNEEGASLSADVLHLCANIIMARNVSGRGHGAIRFDAVPRYSLKLCIESYTLTYPQWDRDFEVRNRFRNIIRRDASTCPPDGRQYWRLPQGTYIVSVAVYYHEEEGVPPRYLGYFQRTISIDRPHWDWEHGGPDYEFAVPFGSFELNPSNLTPGRPPCMDTPTPSVGVGSVNVRLEWRANADLDIWVIDPCNNKIFWNGRTATCQGSLGWLDQDNWCQDFVLGKPENIYWAQNPPQGKYKVYVDYFEDCGNAGPVNYTVRWWVDGKAYVKRGSISPPASPGANGDEILVTQFSR